MDKKYYYLLNYLIIYGKYYVFQCRSNHKNPFLRSFLLLVKDRLSFEKHTYISKGKSKQCDERFGFFMISFQTKNCSLYIQYEVKKDVFIN